MSVRETVTLRIAGKDHTLSCDPADAPGLAAAAQEVERRVQRLREAQPQISSERAMALAALDIAFEASKAGAGEPTANPAQVERLNRRLDEALDRLQGALDL